MSPHPPDSDAARRIADEMTLHAVAGSTGWAVFGLADGRPADHVPYPRRVDAVKAMRWDRDNYLYLQIQPGGMHPREAAELLAYARQLHTAGFRIPSPEFEFDASMPAQRWDRRAQIAHLVKGGR